MRTKSDWDALPTHVQWNYISAAQEIMSSGKSPYFGDDSSKLAIEMFIRSPKNDGLAVIEVPTLHVAGSS